MCQTEGIKNILITGSNSFIGGRIRKIGQSLNFDFHELDLMETNWKDFDFSRFDTIIHVAAIVHRTDITDFDLYKKVNCDLALRVANKAKNSGVSHCVFISTMGVWGIEPTINGNGCITPDSPYTPANAYGESKLLAEIGLIDLFRDSNIALTIVRPPNVYFENCPGNYYRYMQLCGKYLPLFPLLRENKFSMIHVDSLATEILKAVKNRSNGVLCPQDTPLISTSQRIREFARIYGKKQYQSRILGQILRFIYHIAPLKQIRNLFGDMYYDPKKWNEIVPFSQCNFESYQNRKF